MEPSAGNSLGGMYQYTNSARMDGPGEPRDARPDVATCLHVIHIGPPIKISGAGGGSEIEQELHTGLEELRRAERFHRGYLREAVAIRERLDPEGGSELVEIGDGVVAIRSRSEALSIAGGIGVDAPAGHAEVEAIEQVFFRYKLPGRLIVTPVTDLGFLRALCERGWYPVEWNQIMLRPLDPGYSGIDADHSPGSNFPQDTTTSEPEWDYPGVQTRLLNPGEEQRWCEVMAAGFADYREPTLAGPEYFMRLFGYKGATFYAGLVDSHWAGGAMLIVHGDFALLNAAATIPGFRRRGLQNALIRARLRDAAQAGATLVMLLTAVGSDSQRNAERNGLHVAGNSIVWKKDFTG